MPEQPCRPVLRKLLHVDSLPEPLLLYTIRGVIALRTTAYPALNTLIPWVSRSFNYRAANRNPRQYLFHTGGPHDRCGRRSWDMLFSLSGLFAELQISLKLSCRVILHRKGVGCGIRSVKGRRRMMAQSILWMHLMRMTVRDKEPLPQGMSQAAARTQRPLHRRQCKALLSSLLGLDCLPGAALSGRLAAMTCGKGTAHSSTSGTIPHMNSRKRCLSSCRKRCLSTFQSTNNHLIAASCVS